MPSLSLSHSAEKKLLTFLCIYSVPKQHNNSKTNFQHQFANWSNLNMTYDIQLTILGSAEWIAFLILYFLLYC